MRFSPPSGESHRPRRGATCLGIGLAVLIGLAAPAAAYRVVDGDTVILDSGERCRLLGPDAPERGQPLAKEASRALEAAMAQHPTVGLHGRDRYGRALCTLRLPDGQDVGALLVREGLAIVYRYRNGRSADPALVPLEAEARAASRGLWGLACFQTPGDYRRRQPNPCALPGPR